MFSMIKKVFTIPADLITFVVLRGVLLIVKTSTLSVLVLEKNEKKRVNEKLKF